MAGPFEFNVDIPPKSDMEGQQFSTTDTPIAEQAAISINQSPHTYTHLITITSTSTITLSATPSQNNSPLITPSPRLELRQANQDCQNSIDVAVEKATVPLNASIQQAGATNSQLQGQISKSAAALDKATSSLAAAADGSSSAVAAMAAASAAANSIQSSASAALVSASAALGAAQSSLAAAQAQASSLVANPNIVSVTGTVKVTGISTLIQNSITTQVRTSVQAASDQRVPDATTATVFGQLPTCSSTSSFAAMSSTRSSMEFTPSQLAVMLLGSILGSAIITALLCFFIHRFLKRKSRDSQDGDTSRKRAFGASEEKQSWMKNSWMEQPWHKKWPSISSVVSKPAILSRSASAQSNRNPFEDPITNTQVPHKRQISRPVAYVNTQESLATLARPAGIHSRQGSREQAQNAAQVPPRPERRAGLSLFPVPPGDGPAPVDASAPRGPKAPKEWWSGSHFAISP